MRLTHLLSSQCRRLIFPNVCEFKCLTPQNAAQQHPRTDSLLCSSLAACGRGMLNQELYVPNAVSSYTPVMARRRSGPHVSRSTLKLELRRKPLDSRMRTVIRATLEEKVPTKTFAWDSMFSSAKKSTYEPYCFRNREIWAQERRNAVR